MVPVGTIFCFLPLQNGGGEVLKKGILGAERAVFRAILTENKNRIFCPYSY